MNSINHHGSRFFCSLGILFLSILFLASSSLALEIRIREKALVRDDKVELGDIASFSPSNDRRIPELKNILISASPSPGSVFRINERLLINKMDVHLAAYDDIRVIMPENLQIHRSAQYINPEELEGIFEDHVRSLCPYPQDQIVIDRINASSPVPLPEGRLTWRIQDRDNEDFTGNVSITIDFMVDGRPIRKVSVSGSVSLRQEVIKSLGKIRKGDTITEDAILISDETAPYLLTDALTDRQDIIGKKASRNIQADSIITKRMVEDPPLVRKGKGVVIIAENEEIRISTLGKVTEDGCEGDQVKVINLRSGKEIYATVTGPGIVQVSF